MAAIAPAPGHWARSIDTGNGIYVRQMCAREVMNALEPNEQEKGESDQCALPMKAVNPTLCVDHLSLITLQKHSKTMRAQADEKRKKGS